MPLGFGGPHLGFLSTSFAYVRELPGRLAGATTDEAGNRGFVLTLATREQHIRREKATSNICTNQALCALAATIYLAVMGKGLTDVARQSHLKARYLAQRLADVPGVTFPFAGPTYNEFVYRVPGDAKQVLNALADVSISGGVMPARWELGERGDILTAITEQNTRRDIDRYADTVGRALA